MNIHRPLSVKAKLNILNIIIILSGVLGIIGAFEIAKGAKLHELNILHFKYTLEFSHNVDDYEHNRSKTIKLLYEDVLNIRQQPIDCLAIANPLERQFMKIIGTYSAIEICQLDLELANKTIDDINSYEDNNISKSALINSLSQAVAGFSQHSEMFYPVISKTVSLILKMMIGLIIFKSILVTLIGILLSRSLSADYKKLAETEISLEERTEKLEEKNAALEQFSYHTSHDLKSPLTSIRGLIHFIKQDIKDDKTDDAIDNIAKIEQLAQRGEELIKDILAITRSDTLSKDNTEINVDIMIREISQQLSVQSGGKKIQIMHHHKYTGLVSSHAIRLRNILENLLSNAIKYSNPNRDNNIIETIIEANDSTLIINVKDNGLGIPKAQHYRVFEMFSRFHRESAAGSGLGLYLVKKHVAQINGMINFTSEPGNTCFTISLPLKTNGR